jgi:hypothetical protein
MVRLEGETSRTIFHFRAFTRTVGGDEFVELFGGKKGHQKMRYVAPSRVSKIAVKQRRVRNARVTA